MFRKNFFYFVVSATLIPSLLLGKDPEIDPQNISSEQIQDVAQPSPFGADGRVDWVAPAKIKKGLFKGEKIEYGQYYADMGAVFYYNQPLKEGARIALGFGDTVFEWKENPWIKQSHFNTLYVTLSSFTERWNDWFWRGQATVNIDASHWGWYDNSYDWILWGAYAVHPCFHCHIGGFLETGLHSPRFWPIIGIDWTISKRLTLNLVYPMNISLEYAYTSTWSLVIAGRTFTSRFRSHHQRNASDYAVVRYQNAGAEIAIKGTGKKISGNLHIGSTLGGSYRLANKESRNPMYYRLDPAFYAGGELAITF